MKLLLLAVVVTMAGCTAHGKARASAKAVQGDKMRQILQSREAAKHP